MNSEVLKLSSHRGLNQPHSRDNLKFQISFCLKLSNVIFFVIENHKKKDRQQIELSTGLYIAFPSLSTSNLNV